METFASNHINGQVLFELTENDLKNEFKIASIGHRKNFMKAVENLKMIYESGSGKNSDYIKKKIQKFYEKNKKGKMGIINSLGNAESILIVQETLQWQLFCFSVCLQDIF